MRERAIFFDFDGTLADTREDLAATVNHTRRDFSLEPLDAATIISYVGNGARKLLERAIPEIKDPPIDVFMSHYLEHALESIKLYPGVRETLDYLYCDGWKLGINTAKPRKAVDLILRKLDLESYFGNAIVAGGDCSEMKPSALPLKECAAKMHHKLSAFDWMVGDNWTDIECAANAGIGSIYCNFGFGIIKESVPIKKIDSFEDLFVAAGVDDACQSARECMERKDWFWAAKELFPYRSDRDARQLLFECFANCEYGELDAFKCQAGKLADCMYLGDECSYCDHADDWTECKRYVPEGR